MYAAADDGNKGPGGPITTSPCQLSSIAGNGESREPRPPGSDYLDDDDDEERREHQVAPSWLACVRERCRVCEEGGGAG
jgi:hypothetical protein